VWLAIKRNADTRFYSAIRKHGVQNFCVSVLQDEISSLEYANLAERRWVAELSTFDKDFGYNMTDGGDQKDSSGWIMSLDARVKISASKLGKPLVTRTRKTDEKHRPIVDGFKAGKSRKELAIEFNVHEHNVVKILLRWKRLHDLDLPVGSEHQYVSSGKTLQKNALKRNQRMIDMVIKEGKTRKQTAIELCVSYALVKNVVRRHTQRFMSVDVAKDAKK
jgi:transposase